MPGKNATGPTGAGPMTGRGLGPCGDGKNRGQGAGLGQRFRRFMNRNEETTPNKDNNESSPTA